MAVCHAGKEWENILEGSRLNINESHDRGQLMQTKPLNTFFGSCLGHTLPAWLHYQRDSFVLTELIIVKGACVLCEQCLCLLCVCEMCVFIAIYRSTLLLWQTFNAVRLPGFLLPKHVLLSVVKSVLTDATGQVDSEISSITPVALWFRKTNHLVCTRVRKKQDVCSGQRSGMVF